MSAGARQGPPFKKVLAYVAIILALIPLLYLVQWILRGRLHANGYRQISLGKTRTEAETSFWSKSDLTLDIGTCHCVYYQGPDMFAQSVIAAPEIPTTIGALPSFYDAIQVLYDSEDKVIAFAWVGEGLGTSTVDGALSGRTGLKELPPEVIQKLDARCGLATRTEEQRK